MPSVGDIFFVARMSLRGDQFITGPVVKQYGPFRLHRYAIKLKGGRLMASADYWVVACELSESLSLSLRSGRADPNSYSRIIKDREGPFRDCVDLGEVPIKRSTALDI